MRSSINPRAVSLPLVICLLFLVWARCGGARGLIAFGEGQLVLVEPVLVELGDVQGGGIRDVALTTRKLAMRRVSLIGVESSCSCAKTGHLPIQLGEFETHSQHISIKVPNAIGPFQISTVLLFDAGHLVRVPVAIRGSVSTLGDTRSMLVPVPEADISVPGVSG